MSASTHEMIVRDYCEVHRRALEIAEGLTDAQLAWQPVPGAVGVAFHLWHLARWADHIQAALPGMSEALTASRPPGAQIWDSQGLARAWGFDSAATGYAETGMDMDEALAARLTFPPKETLLAYARAAFAAACQAAESLDETLFLTLEQPQPLTDGIYNPGGTIGEAFFSHMRHAFMHFGAIGSLLGLQRQMAE